MRNTIHDLALKKHAMLCRSLAISKKITYCLTVCMILLHSVAFASAQTVSLNVDHASLKSVLTQISKQTKMDLIGDFSDLRGSAPITLKMVNENVSTALSKVFENQPVEFKIVNNTIVVKRKSQQNNRTIRNEVGGEKQDYTLDGFVRDVSGKPLAGVSVKLNDSKNWASVSGRDGSYAIIVNSNSKITFSMIGYETLVVEVSNKRHIDVVLKAVEKEIDEAIVTGYTRVDKSVFTGAARIITRKELEKFNNNNIFSILQALDPALKIGDRNESGSNPNQIPEINIRGLASVGDYSVNAPLVILDGFESKLTTLYDIDINRIESISILKDASSTSLYGSRGSNGVIVIETRLPKDGKFTVTYDAKPSLTLVDLSDYNLMNAKEKLEYEKLAGIYNVEKFNPNEPWDLVEQEAFDNLYTERQRAIASGVDTYWLSQPVTSTLSVNHSLRIEGGANDVRYSLEGNYNDFKGAMKESGRLRGGAAFNLNYRIRDKIIFDNRAAYQYTKAYNSPYGNFSQYTSMNPYERIYDDNGKLIVRYAELGDHYSFGPLTYNPLYNAGLGFKDDNVIQNITNNTLIDWFVSSEFRIRARGMISRSIVDVNKYVSPYHTSFFSEMYLNRKGSYVVGNSNETNYEANLNLDYNKLINKHQFSGNLIGEIRSGNNYSISNRLTGFVDDRFISSSVALNYAEGSRPATSSSPKRSVGILGNAMYTFDNKYVVNGTFRSDGSSLFGKENRFGTFWSVGVSYNIDREAWFKRDIFNRLRVFGNYGTNGSESFSADMLNTAYRFVSGNFYFNQYSATYTSQGNRLVSWPIVNQLSLGTSFGLFKDLVGIDFNYYERITDKMISTISVAPSLGFAGNSFYQNLGKVSNKGFEFNANVRVYENNDKEMSWYVAFGATQNRGKLLEISNELRKFNETSLVTDPYGNVIKPSVFYEEGQSLSIIRGVESLGIDPASGKEMFLNRNGEVTYVWNASDQKVIGDSEALL